jgi:hypothetical protein
LPAEEKEQKQSCDHCGAKWTIIYDVDQCDAAPEACPFCGAEAFPLDSDNEGDYNNDDDGDDKIYESDKG